MFDSLLDGAEHSCNPAQRAPTKRDEREKSKAYRGHGIGVAEPEGEKNGYKAKNAAKDVLGNGFAGEWNRATLRHQEQPFTATL